MWGSAFADLAKKAQELQEQASNLSTTTGGLFNLDNMQASTDGDKSASKNATLQQEKQQPQKHDERGYSFAQSSNRSTVTMDAPSTSSSSPWVPTSSQPKATPLRPVKKSISNDDASSLFATPTPSPRDKKTVPLEATKHMPHLPMMETAKNRSGGRTVNAADAAAETATSSPSLSAAAAAADRGNDLNKMESEGDEQWEWSDDNIHNDDEKLQKPLFLDSFQQDQQQQPIHREEEELEKSLSMQKHEDAAAMVMQTDDRQDTEPAALERAPESTAGVPVSETKFNDDADASLNQKVAWEDDDLDGMYDDDDEEEEEEEEEEERKDEMVVETTTTIEARTATKQERTMFESQQSLVDKLEGENQVLDEPVGGQAAVVTDHPTQHLANDSGGALGESVGEPRRIKPNDDDAQVPEAEPIAEEPVASGSWDFDDNDDLDEAESLEQPEEPAAPADGTPLKDLSMEELTAKQSKPSDALDNERVILVESLATTEMRTKAYVSSEDGLDELHARTSASEPPKERADKIEPEDLATKAEDRTPAILISEPPLEQVESEMTKKEENAGILLVSDGEAILTESHGPASTSETVWEEAPEPIDISDRGDEEVTVQTKHVQMDEEPAETILLKESDFEKSTEGPEEAIQAAVDSCLSVEKELDDEIESDQQSTIPLESVVSDRGKPVAPDSGSYTFEESGTSEQSQEANLEKDAGHAGEPPLPASVMENFALQMQRLEQNHNAEVQDMERRHKTNLDAALESVNHKCEAQQREMEQRFLAKLSEKEAQLQEVMRVNEGQKLKIDVMKRELLGTQALLEERDSTMGSVNESHNKSVQLLEEKISEMEKANAASEAETQKFKDALQEAKEELEASNEAYATLKSRVKVVATELKERRIECRTLNASVEELTEANDQLQTQLTNLKSQLSERDRSHTEKDEETSQLRSRVDKLEDELKVAEKGLKERDAVAEKALAAYKKKAQSSLAAANARTASAVQAKEEADAEAAAARRAADEALKRARIAEANGQEALLEAKEYVRDMETEKADLEEKMSDLTASLGETREQLQQVRGELKESEAKREKLSAQVTVMNEENQRERAKNSELQADLKLAQSRSNELYDEVETLREELRKSANAAFMANSQANGDDASPKPHVTGHSQAMSGTADKSETEGTILMLQSELRDANRAIKELKETVRATIEKDSSNGHRSSTDMPSLALHSTSADAGSFDSHDVPAASHVSATRTAPLGNDSTPLFFAMEKQAELNTARDEINRLANLLGDAESEKMAAYDAMDEMRRKMEEAESRLLRYEKLGMRQQPDATEGSRPIARSAPANSYATADGRSVNLEYLKNVMLSYLNAKTLTERKALVPVVGAVLCLTAEEQAKALKSVEESGSLEGVGMSLFEQLGSHVKNAL